VQALDICHFGAICPQAAGSLNPRFPQLYQPHTSHSTCCLRLQHKFHACRNNIERIRSVSAFCGATYPPPTHSLTPQLPPPQRPCTPDPTHLLHPHHKFYTCQSDIECIHLVSIFLGQHAHPPHILSTSGLHHLKAHTHSTLHTSCTPTMSFMCSRPTLSAYAQCLPLGVKYPTPHLCSPTRHPTTQTLTSTSFHTLPLPSPPCNFNGQVILSAYAQYMAVQVNFPAPHLISPLRPASTSSTPSPILIGLLQAPHQPFLHYPASVLSFGFS
jgi:hypothetical protein